MEQEHQRSQPKQLGFAGLHPVENPKVNSPAEILQFSVQSRFNLTNAPDASSEEQLAAVADSLRQDAPNLRIIIAGSEMQIPAKFTGTTIVKLLRDTLVTKGRKGPRGKQFWWTWAKLPIPILVEHPVHKKIWTIGGGIKRGMRPVEVHVRKGRTREFKEKDVYRFIDRLRNTSPIKRPTSA